MSRSTNSTKGPGFEFWSRRAWGVGGKWLAQPGRWTKTLTHRRERRAAKRVLADIDS